MCACGGLRLGEFVDLKLRIVEERVMGLCQELKDCLMSSTKIPLICRNCKNDRFSTEYKIDHNLLNKKPK